VTTLWDRREALHQSRMADLTSGFTPMFNTVLSSLQGMGLSDQAAKAAVTNNMVGQAYLLASVDIFYVSGWLCLAAIVLVWFCRRPSSSGTMPALD
ncbi:MAG TPA: hypothetical protein VGC86_16095, partial [Afipia sp.]